jgi:hypothetical protein
MPRRINQSSMPGMIQNSTAEKGIHSRRVEPAHLDQPAASRAANCASIAVTSPSKSSYAAAHAQTGCGQVYDLIGQNDIQVFLSLSCHNNSAKILAVSAPRVNNHLHQQSQEGTSPSIEQDHPMRGICGMALLAVPMGESAGLTACEVKLYFISLSFGPQVGGAF